MSRNEDYLDNLLNSVTTKLNEFDDDFQQNRESLRESYRTQNSLPERTQSALDEMRGDNFLRDYEEDLDLDAEDDFIREFERELEGEADSSYGSSSGGFEDQMDQLLNEAGQETPMQDSAAPVNDFVDDNLKLIRFRGHEDFYHRNQDLLAGMMIGYGISNVGMCIMVRRDFIERHHLRYSLETIYGCDHTYVFDLIKTTDDNAVKLDTINKEVAKQ